MSSLRASPASQRANGTIHATHLKPDLVTPRDSSFDRITELAARIFDAPVAVVAIADEDRIRFASRFGLDGIGDVAKEPGLVAAADALGFGFRACAPLVTRAGFELGTLCVMDYEARTPTTSQLALLTMMAGVVTDEIELRVKTAGLFADEREMSRAAASVLAGVAIEGEARYLQEHNIAQAFQHALLPQFLPEAENVHLDAIYAAADDRDLVGGDWYDAFAVDDGKIVISIGDVGGHGLDAAVWMGKVSQSLRALSLIETEPHKLLTCLDRLLDRYEANIMITAFVALLDPKTGELRYSSAGHSPPFVRLADGTVTELRIGGVPLGVPIRPERQSDWLMLAPGSLVLLYTDGLTEATRDVIEGERSVREALAREDVARAQNPAQALRDAVLSRASFDDVAILTIRFG